MTNPNTPLFEVMTPLNFTVRTSSEYWQKILMKHPDLANRLEDVKIALEAPSEIRRSQQSQDIFLFYSFERLDRWVVAVAKRLNGDGFLITAYRTDAIKEGEEIWHR